jgi:hypothetical protein
MAVLVGFIIFFDRYGEVLVVKAWEADPANSYEVAVKYVQEGRLEEAAEKFEMARRQAEQPGASWPAYKVRDIGVNLGRIYYELGQHDKALPLLQEVVASAPGLDHGTPLSYLADIHLERGEKDKAAELFKATTEWNFGPRSVIAFFRLGQIAAEKAEYEAALSYLDTAVTLDAGNQALTGQMWASIATIAREAVTETEDATSAFARELLGVSEYRMKQFDTSVEALEAALGAGRDTARIRYFLAKVYDAIGMQEKANQHLLELPKGTVVVEPGEMVCTFGRAEDGGWVLVRNAALRHEVFLVNQIEAVEVLAKGTSADFVGANMIVRLAGEVLGEAEVSGAGFERYSFPASVSEEHGLLEIEFANDYRDPETGEDRNLSVNKAIVKYGAG